MDDRQLDLFAPRPAEKPADNAAPRRRSCDPALLTDEELVRALPGEGLQDRVALAAEAGRRRLKAAVPGLRSLCRYFAAWGVDAPVPEQVAALDALARIGGAQAASAVVESIVKAEIIGATLGPAVAAAAALGATFPEEKSLQLLRHADPALRADACRCTKPSPAVIATLIELLDDLHPSIHRAAACALGRMGRVEARRPLVLLLDQAPDAEIVEAIGRVADAECLIRLRRTAEYCPSLIDDVIDALEMSDDPRAAALAEQLTAPA